MRKMRARCTAARGMGPCGPLQPTRTGFRPPIVSRRPRTGAARRASHEVAGARARAQGWHARGRAWPSLTEYARNVVSGLPIVVPGSGPMPSRFIRRGVLGGLFGYAGASPVPIVLDALVLQATRVRGGR